MPRRPNLVCIREAEDHRLRSRYMRELIQTAPPPISPVGRVRIPRVLVQFWHDATAVPADVRECLRSWQPLTRRGFTRAVFDDTTARGFILDALGQPYLAAYDRCRHPAMRCDYFRLCYIWRRGGFYVDADDVFQGGNCETLYRDNRLKLQPLCFDAWTEQMVRPELFIGRRITSPNWIFYVNNNPLVAPAGHPVIARALHRATRRLLDDNAAHFDIQSATGPGNLTASLVAHSVVERTGGWAGGGARDVLLLSDWAAIAECRWELSYRSDDRNWRLWRPQPE